MTFVTTDYADYTFLHVCISICMSVYCVAI